MHINLLHVRPFELSVLIHVSWCALDTTICMKTFRVEGVLLRQGEGHSHVLVYNPVSQGITFTLSLNHRQQPTLVALLHKHTPISSELKVACEVKLIGCLIG